MSFWKLLLTMSCVALSLPPAWAQDGSGTAPQVVRRVCSVAGPSSLARRMALVPPPRLEAFAQEYALLHSPDWRLGLPNLGAFEVLAPSHQSKTRGGYNCISHSLQIYDRWTWPGATLTAFDKLYASHGYQRSPGLDYRLTDSHEKIVLYARRTPDGRLECTHASWQRPDGDWESKLGAGPQIRHTCPKSLSGPSYGRPFALYVRERATRGDLPAPEDSHPRRSSHAMIR